MSNEISGLIFVLLLALDLLFTAIRTAMVNVRLPYLVGLREGREQAVDRTQDLLARTRLRASLRLMVSLGHVLLVAAGWWLAASTMGMSTTLGSLLGGCALGIVLILLVESLVERAVFDNPELWAVRLTPVASVADALLSPVSALMTALVGASPALEQRRTGGVTEDELKTWVEVGQPDGALEQDERQMIASIFEFSDTLCREVMVPRIDVLALDRQTSLGDAVQALLGSGHSRVPVYDGTIDNIVGLLYAKDLLRATDQGGSSGMVIADLLRPAYFVPESKKVDELLREMQARGVHMAIVVDEYGGMAGLVTLEDIVEEIVGEIRDEYDQGEDYLYQEITPDEFVFTGRLDMDDLNELLNLHIVQDQADTLGGYIYGQMGRVPLEGDRLKLDGWTLTVEQVSGRRIRKVRARRQQTLTETEELLNDQP